MLKRQRYDGTCYIGSVGSEIGYEECSQSRHRILIRPGDEPENPIMATKGYEARQAHIDNFLKSKHDFLLLLDADMTFPEFTLERLRSHGLPYVSGLYMRRRFAPIYPVWYEYPERWTYPMQPFVRVPEPNTLYKLGASGWGCMLIHREVIEETRKILKGEPDVIEDDMDLWPYDLARLSQVIGLLNSPEPKIAEAVTILREELRPLRGMKDIVGSDIRYPFFAREAGYTLYGDSGVRCKHMLNYPLDPDDFTNTPEEFRQGLQAEAGQQVDAQGQAIAQTIGKLEELRSHA